MKTQSGLNKAIAAITAIALLSVILLAGLFIILEADHDCEGEDCPVCECIEQCQATLHQLGTAAVTGMAVLFPILLLIASGIHFVRVVRRETPVSIKVQLNN
ncbi:MAG: hypothetical protein IKS75_08820 [Clostridiales bacterium]|nr:hypothetical protein [Clostridiales bacterium]